MRSKVVTPKELLHIITSERTLLFSIQPEYSQLILKGKKKIELRKRAPKERTGYALIYESSPTRSIVGAMKVKKVETLPLRKLWKEVKEKAAIDKKFFKQYYADKEEGVSIEVTHYLRLDAPVSLEKLRRAIAFNPPQDFCYLDNNSLEKILR